LVGDGIYAEFFDEFLYFGWLASSTYSNQCLGERVCSTPEANPHWTWVVEIGCADDGLGAFGGLIEASGSHAVAVLAGEDPCIEIVRGGPVLRVEQQVGADLLVGLDEGAHGFRMDRRFLPGGRNGDEGFDVDLVRIKQEADERHLVVGFVAYVADNDRAGVTGEIVDVGRWDGSGEVGSHR
jgi:hypothetical protein